MPDFTDPTAALAQKAPGELGLAADWNTYALNNVEAVATAAADTITDLEDHWGGSIVAQRSGRFGFIRVGASQFDFLPVSWDTDLSRWVSPTYSYGSSGERPSETAAGENINYVLRRTTTSGTSVYWGPLIPWQIYNNAGLIVQFRWLWVASTTSASWSVFRMVQGVDMGGEFSGTTWAIGSAATGSQTDPTLQGDSETAWLSEPISPTADYICPGLSLGIGSAVTATVWQVTFFWRWVSQ